MEAALRTAAVKLTGEELGPLVFEDVRGRHRAEGGHHQHRRHGRQHRRLQRPDQRQDHPGEDQGTAASSTTWSRSWPAPAAAWPAAASPTRPATWTCWTPSCPAPARQGPLQDRHRQAAAAFPREPRHRAPLPGLPGRAQRREGPPPAPHPLPRPACPGGSGEHHDHDTDNWTEIKAACEAALPAGRGGLHRQAPGHRPTPKASSSPSCTWCRPPPATSPRSR